MDNKLKSYKYVYFVDMYMIFLFKILTITDNEDYLPMCVLAFKIFNYNIDAYSVEKMQESIGFLHLGSQAMPWVFGMVSIGM